MIAALCSSGGVAPAALKLCSHMMLIMWSNGEADINNMDLSMAELLAARTNESRMLNESGWVGRCNEHNFLIFSENWRWDFLVSVNSSLLANVSNKGFNVYSSLAAPSAALVASLIGCCGPTLKVWHNMSKSSWLCDVIGVALMSLWIVQKA